MTPVTGGNCLKLLCALGHRCFPAPSLFFDGEREMCVMTDLPFRTFRRLQEWFDRWRPAHVELEDESDEELKDIGLEPLRRNFTAVKPFWMP